MRLISVEKVHFGHALNSSLYSMDGQLLFTAGTKLEAAVLDKLVEMGYRTLVISDSQDAGIDPKPLISDGLRLSGIKVMHKILESLRGHTDINTAPELGIPAVYEVCNAIVDEVALGERTRVIDVLDVKSMKNYTEEHSVQVAVLSAYVGARLGYNLMHLRNLVVGAYLHDIGEAFLPPALISKTTKYSPDDIIKMQQHGIYGFRYLSRFSDINATSRAITIQHHERVSGKGYPKGFGGSQIHQYSGIVGACDVFDAMTSDRPYRPRHPAIVALGVLMSSKESLFAPELREIFSQLFAPFPIGAWVTLSDGRHGIVKAIPKTGLARPDVKVIYDSQKKAVPAAVVQLSLTPELRVAGIPADF